MNSIQRLAVAASLFVVVACCLLLLGSPTAAAQAPIAPDRKTDATPPTTPGATSMSPAEVKPVAPVVWKRVPDAEKKILAPLEAEWPKLPGAQQRQLLGAARHFPKLTPVEQERFRERLTSWSALTPEQRAAARDKYQTLTNLPTSKQEELKARWQHDKQADKAAKDNAAAPAAAK